MSILPRLGLVLPLLLLSAACVTDTESYNFVAAQDNFLNRYSETLVAQKDQEKTIFVGLSLWGQQVFENDGLLMKKTLTNQGDQPVTGLLFSNLLDQTPKKFGAPLADDAHNLFQVIDRFANKADRVVILMTSHGTKDKLCFKLGGNKSGCHSGTSVGEMLAPLKGRQVWLIIQACYSGSLIKHLSYDKWVVFTAARHDRSSFGCGTDNKNTFFVDSLTKALRQGNRTVRTIFDATVADVTQKEKVDGEKPSLPQLYVGKKRDENEKLL